MTLRIGVLGAALITRSALLAPAKKTPDVTIAAIAARDPRRARAYAGRHGIPTVHASYEELLADPDLDAVYIPSPAALHGRWSIAALEAGKHVLVEKPFTANAIEAQRVAEAAGDLVLMEAFHSLYHPLVAQVRGILDSGVLGRIESADASFSVLIPFASNIRWSERLGGGALMDVGCYPLRMLQHLFGYDATVLDATASLRHGVDGSMRATLALPGLPVATISSSMWSRRLLSSRLEITGSAGRLSVRWPFQPQVGVRIHVRTESGATVYPVDRTSTYRWQLAAFRDAVLHGSPLASPASESIAMMRVIDAIYERAGMRPRQPLR